MSLSTTNNPCNFSSGVLGGRNSGCQALEARYVSLCCTTVEPALEVLKCVRFFSRGQKVYRSFTYVGMNLFTFCPLEKTWYILTPLMTALPQESAQGPDGGLRLKH
jgi:hypothetical protein